jgi:hypothetical protein
MFGWAHRLAVLLLPIIGLSLALVYVNRRQYFIYDHLLVATNLLSFSFLTNAFCMVLPMSAWPTAFGILSLWTPINLFQTLRGGYGSRLVRRADQDVHRLDDQRHLLRHSGGRPDALHPFTDVGPAFDLLRPHRQSRRNRPSDHPHRP